MLLKCKVELLFKLKSQQAHSMRGAPFLVSVTWPTNQAAGAMGSGCVTLAMGFGPVYRPIKWKPLGTLSTKYLPSFGSLHLHSSKLRKPKLE